MIGACAGERHAWPLSAHWKGWCWLTLMAPRCTLAADYRHTTGLNYMEYNGDLSRHSIRNYWHEVGTKFDDCGTNFVETSTKYNPEVIKHTP